MRILLALSFAIVVARVIILGEPPQDASLLGSYKAVAHCFVGGLFGAWFADRKRTDLRDLALVLTAVEIVAAISSRI